MKEANNAVATSCDVVFFRDDEVERFVPECLQRNRIGVFSSSVSKFWDCSRTWKSEDSVVSSHRASDVQLDGLLSLYSNCEVSVARCYQRDFSDQKRECMSLKLFAKLWNSHRETTAALEPSCLQEDEIRILLSACRIVSFGVDRNSLESDLCSLISHHLERRSRRSCQMCSSSSCNWPQYAKDWHLSAYCKANSLAPFYKLPKSFSNDWLNLFCDSKVEQGGDDFRFVYFGPRQAFTPLHADVYSSYSWSCNVVGRKLWILFPEEVSTYLLDANHNCVFDVLAYALLPEERDNSRFPDFQIALDASIWLVQEEGQLVFIPSNVYHQVHNLDAGLSVNHNWANGFCILRMWHRLVHDFSRVCQEISDCRDGISVIEFFELCEKLLQSFSGHNIAGFLELLFFVVDEVVLPEFRDAEKHHLPDWKVLSNSVSRSELLNVLDEIIDGGCVLGPSFSDLLASRSKVESYRKKLQNIESIDSSK